MDLGDVLTVRMTNYGPIEEAEVRFGAFTVLGGANSSGKTLVSKMLYSMLSARNRVLENKSGGGSVSEVCWSVELDRSVGRNFDIWNLAFLRGSAAVPMSFGVSGLGAFRESADGSGEVVSDVGESLSGRSDSVSFPDVFYLDSSIRTNNVGILLDSERSGLLVDREGVDRSKNPLYDLYEQMRSWVGGRLVRNHTLSFLIDDGDRAIPLSLVSSSSLLMGLLSNWLASGRLQVGSWLFVDGPEAYLHPSQQVLLMPVLFELAASWGACGAGDA